MKLKDSKDCQCSIRSHQDPVRTLCRFGYCTIFRCFYCHMEMFSAGPVACPHKKNENGTLRWYKYPDMDTKPHVPVKRSIKMRKRNQPRKFTLR